MFSPVMRHFEEQGMFTFFMSRLVLRSVTYDNADSRFSRAQLRLGIDRYNSYLEYLIEEPGKKLPLLYDIVAHSAWDARKHKMAIIRHDLKPVERKAYC
jgi:hypothetical protein